MSYVDKLDRYVIWMIRTGVSDVKLDRHAIWMIWTGVLDVALNRYVIWMIWTGMLYGYIGQACYMDDLDRCVRCINWTGGLDV